ncbi:lactate utilization protein [Halocalculus aciditolerans]|nr:lactate utilization protein [Halocalculus aciditolerans]
MGDQRKADYLEAADVEPNQWDSHPSDAELEETVENLEDHGFEVEVVADADAALEFVQDEIPDGASVMDGHSTTLEEIGFMEHLHEGDHEWENLHEHVFSIDDDEARAAARRDAQTADYFLGGANAIARTGALVAADASGSRVGAYPFAAKHLLVVAGVNKIQKDVETARKRLRDYAYRLEDERSQDAYGAPSAISKELVYHRERTEGRTTVVLVEETLGY